MDISLIAIGAMTLLKPLLEKAGDKAAETIGQKLAEKSVEKAFWQKIKGLFINDEQLTILEIENKSVATKQDIELIESKLTNEIISNHRFADEINATFNFSSTDNLLAEELLKSIKKGQEKIKQLFRDRADDPSIETEGSYKIMIRKVLRRLEEDESEFLELVKKKGIH